MADIQIPSFEFSAFYYPQLIDALILFKRRYLPELTDESDFEPSIQLLRAFALTGHLNNVLLDMIANESTLATAQLPETIRNMLRLIDYELSPASPAQVDMLYELSRPLSATTQIVPDGAQTATRRDGDAAVVYFEADAALSVTRTDQIEFAFTTEDGDVTTLFNTSIGGFTLNLFQDEFLYIGHSSVMWNKMNIPIDPVFNPGFQNAFWEYFDGNLDVCPPTSVTNIGGGVLEFNLTSLLGALDRHSATVRIRLNSSKVYEDVISTWNGTTNVARTSLLGQSTVSLVASDYTIGTEWRELPMNIGPALGDLSFTLPQDLNRNWRKTTFAGFTGFFLRYRVLATTNGSDTTQTTDICRIDTGKQYVLGQSTQGRTVSNETLGSSNGEASQVFESARENFIDNSQVLLVSGVQWTAVKNFLNSLPQDRHYVLELGEKDRASFLFGDGKNGAIPAIGQGNIVVSYRFGANDAGNVGDNTITVDKTGLTFVNRVYNPRPAAGWAESQAASVASLEQAKIAGPASLRTKEVALGPDDLVLMTRDFVDSGGSKPFSRAKAIEEGFGPKTVELVTVARGGGAPTGGQLTELQTFFNGDSSATPPVAKHFVCNQEVVASAFSGFAVNVTAQVEAPADVTPEAIVNYLATVFQPEALQSDGVTYVWNFGDALPMSRISHEIFNVDPRITKVAMSIPAIDQVMGSRQLPVRGTFAITVVPKS